MLSIITEGTQTMVNIDIDTIHHDNLDDIRNSIDSVIDPYATILINLEMVKYVDSCGISLLVRLHKMASDCKAKIVFCNIQPHFASLLRTTNLDTILNIQQIHTDTIHSKQPRILIVDDLPIICGALSAAFTKKGYKNTYTAHNGADALIKAHELKPDIVLLDYFMPIMNGADCLPIIKRNHPKAKVCIMSSEEELNKLPPDTAYTTDHLFLKKQYMEADVVNYIEKHWVKHKHTEE